MVPSPARFVALNSSKMLPSSDKSASLISTLLSADTSTGVSRLLSYFKRNATDTFAWSPALMLMSNEKVFETATGGM